MVLTSGISGVLGDMWGSPSPHEDQFSTGIATLQTEQRLIVYFAFSIVNFTSKLALEKSK
jgi:hypothetical protein